jgi:hypothetical protein
MKRKIYITVISALFALNTFSQITLKETAAAKSDSTQGFFLKGGTLKLDTLECYNFGEMLVAFNIDKSYFEYDEIAVVVSWGLDKDIELGGTKKFKKAEFAKLFIPQDRYAYVQVFKTENQKENSENFDFTRSQMRYTGSKIFASDCKLYLKILARNITGIETTYETRTDGKVVAKEKEVWSLYETLNIIDIPMLNRIKVNGMAYAYHKFPTETEVPADCYK